MRWGVRRLQRRLWRAVWGDAGDPGEPAVDFYGVGAEYEPVQQPVVKFYEALRAAGNKPEVHIGSAGGTDLDEEARDHQRSLDRGILLVARGAGVYESPEVSI
jgi:hypothetical protein